ncbi:MULTISPECIES: hypothetical protein [unclassified Guyparkeria]|uniref:hypothetical protein n=1 Tax=unclassified Guyparkeria TaxID=2626246 RepID=UPI0007336A1B|nr:MULTISPECIES: hypothetical protein [unclassified Guyparkeria]KTG16604.1 hypothetical protein AUR63_00630 [Guyparkeria sp. XI15]OAE85638.1 hypothetical protein AWR35_00630 [Guyparkeria sp. WRN-7]
MSRFLALLLAGMASPALAGGTATIESTGAGPSGAGMKQAMEVSWQNDSTVRLDPQGQPSYMLVREDAGYSITNAGGQLMVLEMSSIQSMAQSAGAQGPQAPSVANVESVASIEATGREETVAGITGEVYEIHWTGPDGESHVDEAVLSDNPLLREMSAAFEAFGTVLSGDKGDHPMNEALESRGLATLRFGDRYRVSSLSDETPPDSHFELPAEPMQLGTGFGQ